MAEPGRLQVIGAGWCRTGTSSLKVALDTLGYDPCFHGRFIPYLPEFREDCHAYATNSSTQFDVEKHFGKYKAAVDIPAGLIPLVLNEFPKAKARAFHTAAGVQSKIVLHLKGPHREWTADTGRSHGS